MSGMNDYDQAVQDLAAQAESNPFDDVVRSRYNGEASRLRGVAKPDSGVRYRCNDSLYRAPVHLFDRSLGSPVLDRGKHLRCQSLADRIISEPGGCNVVIMNVDTVRRPCAVRGRGEPRQPRGRSTAQKMSPGHPLASAYVEATVRYRRHSRCPCSDDWAPASASIKLAAACRADAALSQGAAPLRPSNKRK